MVLPEIDSTNAEALRRLPSLTTPCWILALRQTAGRGRRGRAWTDPAGNFAATLALPVADPPAKLALRSFLAALALQDALQAATGLSEGFALKWPNDVLLNGGKLSGILLESAGGAGVVLGIGVNLHSSPTADPEAAFPPVSLRHETGVTVPPEVLLDHLAPAYAAWETRFVTYGFDPIRTAFLNRVARLGHEIVARTMQHEWRGRFETIDCDGAMVLRTAEGVRTIPAADIFFP